jgi:hypothetical protein
MDFIRGISLERVVGFFSKLARSPHPHRDSRLALWLPVDYFNLEHVVYTSSYKLDKAARQDSNFESGELRLSARRIQRHNENSFVFPEGGRPPDYVQAGGCTCVWGGQASLRGYRYQLLQSLDAWIGLQQSEVLWLETEEDFGVTSAEATVDAQVKSSAAATGPKPHSLHSKGIRAALNRYWARSGQGRDPRPYLAFIAKGGTAREQGLTFPDNVTGIDYWKSARRRC